MRHIESAVAVLSPDEVEAIHNASLRILERTGVRVPHRGCLERCRELGASADFDFQMLRIPERVMEGVLDELRSLAAPEPAPERVRRLVGRISTQLYVVDYATGTRRQGVLDDVMKGIALVRKLDHITTANAAVVPTDVPSAVSDIVSFQHIYKYSEKPGGTYVLSPFSARHILEMARAMGRSVPFLLDTVSPLQFQANSLEIAALFAAAGQPITLSAMVMAGGTGPVTLAGTLTLQNAEMLASLLVVHALSRSAPPPFTSIPHSLDMRTMVCSFGSPNQALLGMATAQMARRYGLVPESNVGLTDALRPDFQAGYEKGSTAVFSALAGVRTIGAQGLAGADQGFSFEQLVIDNEWLDAFNYVTEGIDVEAETLAEDVIASVGAGGSYLGEPHTAEHMRSSYRYSKLFTRDPWDVWLARGARDMADRAADFVRTATEGYQRQEPVCTAAQADAIDDIANAASEEAATTIQGA